MVNMTDTSVPVWAVIMTPLAAFIGGLLTPWITVSVNTKREREARREARQEASKDRLREFQRQTLLGLQDAVNALLRSEMQIYKHNCESFDTAGIRQSLPEVLDVAGMEELAVATKLSSRVRDATVRDAFSQVTTQLEVASETPVGLVQSRDAMQRGVNMGVRLVELIGERIRVLDEEEA